MTRLADDAKERCRLQKRLTLSLLTALAIGIHMFEFLLPSPLPGFRPGLANIMVVTALILFGSREAWTLTLFRIGFGSFLLGTLFSPTFLLALSGGITSLIAMQSAWGLLGERVSPIGVSVVGAVAHVVGQLFVASNLIVQHEGVWSLLPTLMIMSIITGIINGYLAMQLIRMIRSSPYFVGNIIADNLKID